MSNSVFTLKISFQRIEVDFNSKMSFQQGQVQQQFDLKKHIGLLDVYSQQSEQFNKMIVIQVQISQIVQFWLMFYPAQIFSRSYTL
ncbi:hypothetical protein FGO68_gene10595 [Halteria grandinella]|uniref:Uncharacterized protein n=1 Tax=Halteria grandinella TaxID=5974 RepID=A0A8J8NPZ3_HALGN|nr:hypothetical protein FGO68_gene10595 [Halteria grandinella]